MRHEVTIEPASENEHFVEIVSLAHKIWRAHYPNVISVEQIEYMLHTGYSLEELKRESADERVQYDRALIDDSLIGFSAYGPHSEPGALMLHKLYVDADARRYGCARRLVDTAANYAKEDEFTHIVLRVNKGNELAITAYEKLGFTNEGPIVTDIGGGFCMDDYLMRLQL
jgi:ribosomal protein S18 acetylase RimI-like enzyme